MEHKVSPLTAPEQTRLEECEIIIASSRADASKFFSALREIKYRRLFRGSYSSFDAYCSERWGFTGSRGSQLADHAELLDEVIAVIGEVEAKKVNERATRALKKVPKKRREKVVKEAAKTGKITEASIKEASKSSGPTPDVEVDEMGLPVPEEILIHWHRRSVVQDMMTDLSRMKSAINKAREEEDPLFFNCPQAAVDHLARVRQFLSDCKPYAVCVHCQGRNPARKSCRVCGASGLISKYTYDYKVETPLKAMREKAIAGLEK